LTSKYQCQRASGRVFYGLLMSALTLIVLAYIVRAQERYYDWERAYQLYPGILYVRVEKDQPRKMVVHGVRVDTKTPGLRLHTTPRRKEWVEGKQETDRQTTRDFIRSSRARGIPCVLAVNADAFAPWPAPYNETTPTDLEGLAVSDGVLVSRATGTPSLLKLKSGVLKIERTDATTNLSDVELAISGFALCLDEGRSLPGGTDLHPRTGIGLCKQGRYLVIVVIDGRQPGSVGATTQELGEWLRYFGAHRGINMDGGGSTTLAWWDPNSTSEDKSVLLNSPVGNGAKNERIPPRLFKPTERTVGNNLGVAIQLPQKGQ
jgi:hypothetical protein